MKVIKPTQGKQAIVDDVDFDSLNRHKWHVSKGRNTFYAGTWIRKEESRHYVRMHNLIMGKGVDHVDGNGFNNQRSNLRMATIEQNSANSKIRKDNKSGYKGVYLGSADKWCASIRTRGKTIHLYRGPFLLEAARAYVDASRKCWGEFASNLLSKKKGKQK